MTTRQLLMILVVLVVIGLVVAFAVNFLPKPAIVSPSPTPTTSNVICTMDAKMCPDGSYVGRVGPNCEFAMCPGTVVTASTTGQFQAKLGQKMGQLGVFVTPLEVLEDSRCPTGVQCIQAGTVRLRAEVIGNSTTTQQVFTLGKPVTTVGATITLTDAFPTPTVGVKIPSPNYNFYFQVKR